MTNQFSICNSSLAAARFGGWATRLLSGMAILAMALLCGPSLHAQSSKGILAGTVRDTTGAVVAKATVTVTGEETGETRALETTPQGAYRVEAINPGLYEIQVEMAGFAKTDVKDIRVEPSLVTTYDATLSVGGVTGPTVEVEAITNGINTDNGQLSGTVDSKELADVPIPSLNPFELAASLPGGQLVNPSLNLEGAGGNYEQLIVNGARPRSNNYMLDGQDINDVGIGGQSFNPQVPDMYQTVAVLLNSSSAEYGRSGGAVVNLVTKAGTNQFHGSAFELYSGSGLNALDGVTREGKPFPAGVNPKARYDQHQFGFTAGGPIWKNKLFAFGGTQFTRFYGESASGSLYLPDAAGYAELTAIGNTSTTAGTQIALLQGLLNSGTYLTSYQNLNMPGASLKVSAANCPGGVACSVTIGTFQRPPVAQQEPDTQWMYRIDFIPRSTDTFAFRYLHDRENFTPDLGLNTAYVAGSGLPGFDGQVGGPTELGQGTWTHIFTANLLNEFRASEVRLNTQFAPTPQTLANPLARSYNVNLSGSNLPELGPDQNMPQGRIQELYQFQDTVGWIIGRQSIRIGADIGRDHETDLIAQNALGSLTFAGGTSASLNNFVNNTLGTGGSLTKTFGPTRVDPHLWKLAGFFQDDIKLTTELTVNVGVRYDYDTNPENALAYPAVSLSNPYAPINTVVPVKADLNNFAPRIGFAFNPHEGIFADGKTVFHGGFGVFYDVDFTNILINSAQSSPDAPTTTLTSTSGAPISNPAAALAAATATLTPTSSVLSVASNLVNPITYQYNLGMEREIPAQIKVTLNYVGARGEKLFANQQLNEYYNGARLDTARNAITVRDNGGDSYYNAGQVEVSRRFTHGLFFRAAYTYSKSTDDASEVFALFSNPDTSYQANLGRIAQDHGNSAWDRTHVAAFEYVYSPPGFHSSDKLVDGLLEALTRHFSLSGTTQISSGPYSDVQILGVDTNNDLNPYNDRPIIGNPSMPFASAGIDGYILLNDFGIPATPGVYYDMAKLNDPNTDVVAVSPSQEHFLIPYGVQYTTQEVGRNSYENPGQSFWNMSLEKDIPAAFWRFDKGQFELRVDCQNVGNHNNVSVLDTSLLDVGTPAFLNKSNAREGTDQSFRGWIKFAF
jgi:outer membrane receptor protein involved in Fe transport